MGSPAETGENLEVEVGAVFWLNLSSSFRKTQWVRVQYPHPDFPGDDNWRIEVEISRDWNTRKQEWESIHFFNDDTVDRGGSLIYMQAVILAHKQAVKIAQEWLKDNAPPPADMEFL